MSLCVLIKYDSRSCSEGQCDPCAAIWLVKLSSRLYNYWPRERMVSMMNLTNRSSLWNAPFPIPFPLFVVSFIIPPYDLLTSVLVFMLQLFNSTFTSIFECKGNEIQLFYILLFRNECMCVSCPFLTLFKRNVQFSASGCAPGACERSLTHTGKTALSLTHTHTPTLEVKLVRAFHWCSGIHTQQTGRDY